MAQRPLAGSFAGGPAGPVLRKLQPTPVPPPRIVFPGPLTGETARWLTDWVREVAGMLSGGRLGLGDGEHGSAAGVLDAAWAQGVTASAADFPVPHALGRVPVGYIVAGRDAQATVWDGETRASDDRFLWLRSDVAGVNVRLLVF